MASFTRQISRLGSRLGLAPAQAMFGEYAGDYAVIAGEVPVQQPCSQQLLQGRPSRLPSDTCTTLRFPLPAASGAAFIWGSLNDVTPRAAYIPKDQVAYMNFPLLKDTVSHYQVHIVGVAIPAIVFIAYSLLSKKPGEVQC
jgi:hypothetical protein